MGPNFGREAILRGVSKLRSLISGKGYTRLVATSGAVIVAFGVAVGAGAAPSPIAPISEVLGLSGEHGAAVSEAVAEAKESLEEGHQVGPAVSEAACQAAHDRSTLPGGGDDEGAADGDARDCTHPSNQEDEASAGVDEEATDELLSEELDLEDESARHGAAVSQAVHDAKAAAVENGDKVGPAVSEAACEAAHDRTTLPEGAQNAPGQDTDRPEKDCTHPSNADDSDVESADEGSEGESTEATKSGHGKSSAPGQLKKQID